MFGIETNQGRWLEAATQLRGIVSHLGRSGWLRLGLAVGLLLLVLAGSVEPPKLIDELGSWPGYGRGPAADICWRSRRAGPWS